MIKYANSQISININNFSLKGVFAETINEGTNIIKEKFFITKLHNAKKAFIYLGSRDEFKDEDLVKVAKTIASDKLNGYNIYIESFAKNPTYRDEVVKVFTNQIIYSSHEVWNLKTKKENSLETPETILIGPTELESLFNINKTLASNTNLVRDIQSMPHNRLNSENYPELVKEIFKDILEDASINVSFSVLDKQTIETEKMGLLLAVNAGSAYEPRVIQMTYNGNASTNDRLVMVGKGIMFDSGGMSIKPARFMTSMKYDKSGSAILLGVFKSIVEFKLQTNISILLMCTDNMISNKASKPDDVVFASNGISVEINNTDAEGRLVLADGLVYAKERLHATHLLDISTLTGAIKYTLGKTYTGAWATDDNMWKALKVSAKSVSENIWRLPFHKNFIKNMKKSKVADLFNTNLIDNKGGSICAAMFLKEFTDGLPYVHLDIAGSAKNGDDMTGVMVKTLTYFAERYNKKLK